MELQGVIGWVREIEKKINIFQGVIFALIAAGVGLSFWLAYLNEKLPDQEEIDRIKAEITAHAENEKNKILPKLLAEISKDKRLEFNQTSLLAQISAQASCVALAPPGTTVQAVYRTSTHTNSNGAQSLLCPKICSDQIPSAVGTHKQSKFVGALHIYQLPPFDSENAGTFPFGMATHRYNATDANTGYGPNYCCCAG